MDRVQRIKGIGISLIGVVLSAVVVLSGCSAVSRAEEANFDSAFANEPATEEAGTSVGSYDSADTAIVKEVNEVDRTITLINYDTEKSYTLTYDGTTVILDKYDGSMSMAQVKPGDIVNVNFMKDTKRLAGIRQSPEAWCYDGLYKYNLNSAGGMATIGEDTYSLRTDVFVYSQEKQVSVEEIVAGDTITARGIGHNIMSIIVDTGHGYLRLANDAYVIGGWIEVGQAVIQQITDGMMLTVPEGNYSVRLTGKGVDEIRKVNIVRNMETTIDLGDIEVEEIELGKLLFSLTPAAATLYIDGEETDSSKVAELEYGLHQVMAIADGYDTITQYIKVDQELATIEINMDESTSKTDSDVGSSSTVSGNELTSSSTHRIYVDAPVGAEVYFDNVYVGVAPVNFKKESGSHTITLRKTGYITRSYTVQIEEIDRDVTYSFTDLEPGDSSIVETVTGTTTVSGNSTGTNTTVSGNSTTVSGN